MNASAYPDARLHSLHCYPVKSGRVIDLQAARLGPLGLQHDRSWLIVDAADRFITQRSHPTLARLVALPDADGGLSLTHPEAGTLQWSAPPALPAHAPAHAAPYPDAQRVVRVWRRDIPARDCGPEAAAFVTRLIGEPARLVAAEQANFPDGYPLLICTRESLAALNERLEGDLPMSRFRPNLVLEGWPAWAEDGVREVQIGKARLRLVKACTRCGVTGLDQDSGLPGVDPLPELRRFRYDPALKGVTFGWNAEVVAGAGSVMTIGDPVRVRP